MESPESWDALTASFAVCDLTKPYSAWAFVVVQGLVRDDSGDRDLFLRALEDEEARGEITGPSIPYRVAGALCRAGIVRSPGMIPDPWGKIAGTRLDAIASWGALDGSRLESLRRFREHLHQGSATSVPRSQGPEPHDASSRPDSKRPWWKFW